MNGGGEQSGSAYPLSIHLVPVFPFSLVIAGGMLPKVTLYVNAGKQLPKVEKEAGIFSPTTWLARLASGPLPLVAVGVFRLLVRQPVRGVRP